MLDGWKVSKSQQGCSYCGHEFEPNRHFFSALSEEGEELVREDFCPVCWEKFRLEPHFCYWRTQRQAGSRRHTVDTDLMVEFFEKLAGAEDDRKRAFRFVLALYLMRRKELKLETINRSGDEEVMVFRRKGTGDQVDVANPDLDEIQIQEVSEQLSELLSAAL